MSTVTALKWIVVASLVLGMAPPARAAQPGSAYANAVAREKALRAKWERANDRTLPAATLREARAVVQAFESVVRRHPTSGYCDNALWQAAVLEADLFARVGQESDRLKAVQLFEFLAREYSASPMVRKALEQARRLRASLAATSSEAVGGLRARTEMKKPARPSAAPERTNPTPAPQAPTPAATPPATLKAKANEAVAPPPADADVPPPVPADKLALVTIKDIRRTVLAESVRVSIELDREVAFHEERVENPARLLFDLPGTKAVPPLQDAAWTYGDDVVRQIRVGRHPNHLTRVVLDLEGVVRYSVVTLRAPYRILIDCERQAAPSTAAAAAGTGTAKSTAPANSAPGTAPTERAKTPETPAEDKPPERATGAAATEGNRFSMARQLGLGISRVVIDPGHGGHDPGADRPGLSEAQIVLDIALRVEKLLAKQAGVEVVLTRRTDVFVPLEERTGIANRAQADLFLSIHANASRNLKANGIETYYLNFANNPDAEAVAARENAASGRMMNNLPEIIKAIALNSKLDESKDLARQVQESLAKRLRASNKSLKDLGVKQAPFVVLIGASMPSVLAEVSFLTNKREGQLLQTEAYRQRIAEGLCDAVLRYRRTLKGTEIVASQ